MKKYIIIGAGPYLHSIIDIIHANDGEAVRLYQNMPEVKRDRVPSLAEQIDKLGRPIEVFDSLKDFRPEKDFEYILGCITPLKYKLVDDLKKDYNINIATLCHPHACIGSNVRLGEGVLIGPGCVVGPDTVLEDFCVLNRSVSIGHDVSLGRFSRLAPSVTLGGFTKIGEYCSIGMGATIFDRVHIGDWSVIGAGSLVTKDVPESVLAYGAPAKVIRENNER